MGKGMQMDEYVNLLWCAGFTAGEAIEVLKNRIAVGGASGTELYMYTNVWFVRQNEIYVKYLKEINNGS